MPLLGARQSDLEGHLKRKATSGGHSTQVISGQGSRDSSVARTLLPRLATDGKSLSSECHTSPVSVGHMSSYRNVRSQSMRLSSTSLLGCVNTSLADVTGSAKLQTKGRSPISVRNETGWGQSWDCLTPRHPGTTGYLKGWEQWAHRQRAWCERELLLSSGLNVCPRQRAFCRRCRRQLCMATPPSPAPWWFLM